MTPHCKVYFKHFGYTIADFIPCELCNSKSVDLHHIHGRGKGRDVIENIIALCRSCHNLAHSILPKETVQHFHDQFLNK